MKKGIIMEIRRDVLIMMTPDGQFMNGRKAPDGSYSIGEEITFFPVKEGRRFGSGSNWKTAASILTAAILMITLFSASFIQSNKAYAYVSVDINPSLELSLNKEIQVIDITPYNEDAKILMEKLDDWKKENVSDVTEEILRLSEKLGYLKNDQRVWITSTMTDSSKSSKHSALFDDLNSFVKQYNNLHSNEIIINETSKDIRDKAIEKGITAGAFLKEEVKSEKPKPVKPAGAAPKESEREMEKSADSDTTPVEKEPQSSEGKKDALGDSEQKNDGETDTSSSKGKEKSHENKSNERNKHYEPSHPSQKNHSDSGNGSNNGQKASGEKPGNHSTNKSDNNGQSNREKRKGHGNRQDEQSPDSRGNQNKDKNNR